VSATAELLRCVVCRHEGGPEDFEAKGKRPRCKTCAAEPPEPAAPTRKPRKRRRRRARHRCTACGCQTQRPGRCGFCEERRHGCSITEPPLSPIFFATGRPNDHRRIVAYLQAEEGRGLSLFCEGETPETTVRCPNGHLKEGDNLSPSGRCRACERERKRVARAS
jgi:hypothetical protein